MINKIHFGKRLAGHRKRLGLSQDALSEMLFVTPQAVSKWECGAALPDLDKLLELSHLFHVSINQLLEDENLLANLTSSPADPSQVAYFLPRTERDYNIEWAKEMVKGKWIARNWAYAHSDSEADRRPPLDEVGSCIAQKGGIILETGAGPGGGFMPYILKADPGATVIINDLSPTVVEEWKKFLDKTVDSPNLYYAVFDFCHMPFRDGCIDVISDGGGIGNAEGDKRQALKEAYRVLKPGGMLVTSTGFVTKETLASFPENIQKILLEKRPDIFEDLYEDTVLAGFRKIDSVISGEWFTDTDESTIADLARSLGVNIRFTSYIRYCYK